MHFFFIKMKKDWIKEIPKLIEQDKIYQFYNSSDFRNLKKSIFKDFHYECQECLKKHKYTRATVLHHVKHVDKHPELCLSRYYVDKAGIKRLQLEPVCAECHNMLHPEKGWKHKREARLYIVYGYPGSGKSSYVKSHKKDNDIVYDLDIISKSIGDNWNSRLLANNLLFDFIEKSIILQKQYKFNIYIIRTFPSSEEIKLFDKYNAIYIECERNLKDCMKDRSYIKQQEWEKLKYKRNLFNMLKRNKNHIEDYGERW